MVLKKVDIVELDRQESIINDVKTSLVAAGLTDIEGYDFTEANLEVLNLSQKKKVFISENFKYSKLI